MYVFVIEYLIQVSVNLLNNIPSFSTLCEHVPNRLDSIATFAQPILTKDVGIPADFNSKWMWTCTEASNKFPLKLQCWLGDLHVALEWRIDPIVRTEFTIMNDENMNELILQRRMITLVD